MARKCVEKVVYEDDCVVIKVKEGTKYSVAKGITGCAIMMNGEAVRVKKDKVETNKYMQYIIDKLDKRTILEQLSEEASELSKAAMKDIRAIGLNENVTTTDWVSAEKNLVEEAMDVLTVLALLNICLTDDDIGKYWKWERWAKRLGYKEND